MSAADRAWTAIAVVLAVTLLEIGQVSPVLPVFALQAASSAALAALVTWIARRLWEALRAARGRAETATGPDGGTP
jgi:hypothetical protein